MTGTYADFEGHSLDDGHPFFVGRLPDELCPDADGFEALWSLHPNTYHIIQMHGSACLPPRPSHKGISSETYFPPLVPQVQEPN